MVNNDKKKAIKLPDEQAKEPPLYTYLDKRECEYCEDPIADQAKSTRIHCEYKNDNGVIKDCKTAKARQNDEEERELFRKQRETIKGIDSRIKKMLKEKGDSVDLEALEAYDVDLTLGLSSETKPNGQFTSTYINYKIMGGPFNSKFKIVSNDK